MSAAAIRKQVDSEIADIDSAAYGWHFRPYLLEVPLLAQLEEGDGSMSQVWIVLAEPNDGYSAVFNPDIGKFGLVTGGTIVGIYGGLMETLNAM